MEKEEKQILTSQEAAEYMGVSKSHLYKLTMARAIPHYKPTGKLCYFRLEELKAWLTQNRVSTADEIQDRARNFVSQSKSRKS